MFYLKKISISTALALTGVILTLPSNAAPTPPTATTVIDLNTQKFIGSSSYLDRRKYFNIHSVSIPNDVPRDKLSYLVNELNVTFGRNFYSPFTATAFQSYPNGQQARVQGRDSRDNIPGHALYRDFFSNTSIATEHPFNIFKKVEDGENNSEKRAIAEQNANFNVEAAAAWAVNYYKYFYTDATRPKFYEPMNEPFVHAKEYIYTGDNPSRQVRDAREGTIRNKMIALIKRIGKKFDEAGLDTKIIGYASAWPSVERNNFGHFRERMQKFIDNTSYTTSDDETKSYIDGISQHFYDGVNIQGANSQRSGANMNAIMDLVETYSKFKVGRVIPHTVTEYGGIEQGYGDNYSAVRSIQSVRSINNMLFSLLDKQDRLLTSIPFITGNASWYYNAGNNWQPYGAVIMRPDPSSIRNGEPTRFLWTPRINFYKLWADVKGKRVKALSNNPDVQIQAFVNGDRAYVALNSLSERTEKVKLGFINGMGAVNSVRKKSLKIWQNQAPQYSDTSSNNVNYKVDLIPGETVVLEYKFNRPVSIDESYRIDNFYSRKHLEEIVANRPMNFNLSLNGAELGRGLSYLRFSIGRDHGKSKTPKVVVNGQQVVVPSNWAGGDQHNRDSFFGMISIPVPNNYLRANNQVTVTFPDAGGKISSLILERHKDNSDDPTVEPWANPSQRNVARLDEVRTNWLPSNRYSFSVSYEANSTQELVLSLYGPDGWIKSSVERVLAGSGTIDMTLNLNSRLPVGSGYQLKLFRRPAGANNNQNTLMRTVSNIRVQALPRQDDVNFARNITTLPSQRNYSINVSYAGTAARDIAVEIRRGSTFLTANTVTVPAGRGQVRVPLSFEAPLVPGSNYQLKVNIRPVGTNWQQNTDGASISNIRVTRN